MKTVRSGSVSTAAIVIGVAAIGLYALYKNQYDSASSSDGSGFGGSDDMGDQSDSYVYVGGDSIVDELGGNSTIPDDSSSYLEGYYDLTKQQSVVGEIPSDEPVYDPFGLWTPKDDTSSDDTSSSDLGMSYWNPVSQPDAADQKSGLGLSATDWLLGAAGLAGSYASSFGESLISKSGKGILADTFEGGLKSIPFGQGEKASKYVLGSSDEVAEEITQFGSSAALKAIGSNVDEAAELGIKASGKALTTVGKIGISAIPFIGIVAGSEFDVAVDDRDRFQAYTANILGDVVGGLGGAFAGLFTANPIGVAAGSIGGQIAVQNAVYAGFENIDKIKSSIQSGYNTVSQFVTSPVVAVGNTNKQSNVSTQQTKTESPTVSNIFTQIANPQSIQPQQSIAPVSSGSSSSGSSKKKSSSSSSSAKNTGTNFLNYTGTNTNPQSIAPSSNAKTSSNGVSANIGYKTIKTAFGNIVVKK